MKRSLIIGGSVVLFWLVGAAACGQSASSTGDTASDTASTGFETTTTTSTAASMSTSTTTTTTTVGSTGGATTTSVSTTSTSMGGTGGSGTTSSTGTGGTCSKPGTLHPPVPDAGPGTIYCPFSATMDGGSNDYCLPTAEHCCETPASAMSPSACQAIAQPCASGDTDWQCQDPVADCAGGVGQVCCSNTGAAIGIGGTQGGMTCGNFATGMHGTLCVTGSACPSGSIQMCSSDAECPTGQTCTPFSKAGAQVGGCM